MDASQHLQLQQQQQQQQGQAGPTGMQDGPHGGTAAPAAKRRKRADGTGEDGNAPSEPRRLRRSHEACARCRSKKIKCDSKHPRCTACATAGTECNQEDRHRQTLTPRGYTERLEHQLAQCEALIKRTIPGFTRDSLDEIVAREGIDIGPIPSPSVFEPGRSPFRPDAPSKGYPPMYGPPHLIGPYPHPPPMMGPYGPPYQIPMHPPPGPYGIPPPFPPPQPGVSYPPPPVIHPHPPPPPDQPMAPPHIPQSPQSPDVRPSIPTKGTDPHGHDMSSAQALKLATNFGVSAAITSGLKLDIVHEELPVDPNALPKLELPRPRDASHWTTVSIKRDSPPAGATNTLSLYGPISKSARVEIWLPKDRKFANCIIDVYFTRLNIHRPVYARKDFDKIIGDLYDGVTGVYDPGHLCSIYLIFALGTLSELNHRAVKNNLDAQNDQFLGYSVAKKFMPSDWPTHDEFFERALGVKPDLRVTITSLQALILLHWVLYIERQQRTLWRLVGTLVRLSIELGLHHDPTTQLEPVTNKPIFTEEEAQQRIRLWAIVLIHDRGTAILLGRPLAIATSDSNTPHPLRSKNRQFVEFSEHFELSQPVAAIQADIINSLYAPTQQAGDTVMRNATRIIKGMAEFRRSIPEKYHYYFTGTSEWTLEKKIGLVTGITEDVGLTLLKIGIARILMLRALFSSKELNYTQKHKALTDAIITSHNMIIIHQQLIRFPDIAFFTSPIPLHIAAMVILYGHISKVECLPAMVALDDVWMALDMIPRFRWRWERKDENGGHPLISKLVEHVMGVSLHTIKPSQSPLTLRSELDWDEPMSPSISGAGPSSQTTPIMAPYGRAGLHVYGPQPATSAASQHNGSINRSNSGGSTPAEQPLNDVPAPLFYPFFPEHHVPSLVAHPSAAHNGANGPTGAGGTTSQNYKEILAVAAAAQHEYVGHPSETYMSTPQSAAPTPGPVDSKDGARAAWNAAPNSRPVPSYSP